MVELVYFDMPSQGFNFVFSFLFNSGILCFICMISCLLSVFECLGIDFEDGTWLGTKLSKFWCKLEFSSLLVIGFLCWLKGF